MNTNADNGREVKSSFSKDRKPSFLGSIFQPLPTPPHLRIAREDFDSRLAQRRAAGETASSQESVRPAEPSTEARPEAMVCLPEPPVDSGAAPLKSDRETTSGHLDRAIRNIWKLVCDGIYTEIQAGILISKLVFSHGRGINTKTTDDRVINRRGWDLTGQLPPWARKAFTHGQKTALAFIGKQLKENGICVHSNSYIAKAVGFCVTVVKEAKRIAIRLGLISIDPAKWIAPKRCAIAVIRRKCSQWLSWLDRAPTVGVGGRMPGSLIIDRDSSFFIRPKSYFRGSG